jgi:putative thioredoxin
VPEQQIRAFIEKLLPSAAEAALVRAEQLLAAGNADEAERELEAVKAEPWLDARIEAVRQGIAFARAGADGPGEADLRAKLAADPNDHEARLALAGLFASQRRYASAMDELLQIVRREKNWREGEARRQLLALFNLAADDSQLVAEYRRKLASALH